jgi:hypothetical protein
MPDQMLNLDSGSGCGYGYGDGSGYGYGYGDGTGSGYGDGYGDGTGFGDGFGNGFGFGYGSDYGDHIGNIGKHAVFVLLPWPYVRVGCQCHSIDYWRNHWREVACKEKVSLSQDEVDEVARLLEKAMEVIYPRDLHGMSSRDGWTGSHKLSHSFLHEGISDHSSD